MAAGQARRVLGAAPASGSAAVIDDSCYAEKLSPQAQL